MSEYHEATDFINWFSPEHLMIFDEPKNCETIIDKIVNCGELLIGKNTPFSVANYCAGVTAVLPTNAYARSYGGIDATSFLKNTSIASLDKNALMNLRETVETIGESEDLPNHISAVNIRS